MQTYKEKISIIIPVYNEAERIAHNIAKIREKLSYISLNREFLLVIVDDGSIDNTEKILLDDPSNFVLHQSNQGKGAAFINGYKRIAGEKGDYIVLMDSDLQIDIFDLEAFFNIMTVYNAPVVIGNKRHHYSYTHYTLIRRIVSWTYNLMCRLLFRIPLRDTQCGMKLFKRAALETIIPKLLVKRFAFDLELIVALREKNIRIADAPVNVAKQIGHGSVNLQNIIDTARDTLAVWYRKQKGWYR